MVDAKSIGVISGKGGVGKTTITANIGTVLAHDFDMNVLVMDANVLTSNLGLHMGFVRPPVAMQDLLKKKVAINQVVYVHPSGVNVIPSSITLDESLDVSSLEENIRLLSGQYELILVDSAPGLSKEALAVLQGCEKLMLITNPELPAVTDSMKTIEVAQRFNKHIIGIVVNKVTGRKYELTSREIEKICEHPVIAEIPFDYKVPESIANKTPVVLYSPHCPASKAIRDLAAYMSGKRYMVREGGEHREGVFKKIFRFLFG